MKNFSFETVKCIINEFGAVHRIGEIASNQGISRALVVTDQGIINAGIFEIVEKGLNDSGVDFHIYADVVADPPEGNVLAAVDQAKKNRIDGVIGLGGGSSMDVAKLVAFLVPSSQLLADIYGMNMAKGSRLPLIQVATTAGTGSEVTAAAIVTTGSSEKKGVLSPQLLADIAVLDAELTLGLSSRVTAVTGVDAMVHAIEAYTNKNKKNAISDMLAREALKLLMGNIQTVVNDGYNREARSNMMLGSMFAGQACANSQCSGVHALAYPIGGHFHVPHGLSNALMLPHVMYFNLPCATKEYAELACLLLPDLEETDNEKLSILLIEEIKRLIQDVGLESNLRQIGICDEHIPIMAEDAMKQQRLLVNNPREISYSNAFEIYQKACL